MHGLERLIVNKDVTKRQHPKALQPFLPEIGEFAKFCHFNILHPVLRYACSLISRVARRELVCRLLAIRLELPEDAFVNQFQFDAEGDTFGVYRTQKHILTAMTNVSISSHDEVVCRTHTGLKRRLNYILGQLSSFCGRRKEGKERLAQGTYRYVSRSFQDELSRCIRLRRYHDSLEPAHRRLANDVTRW